MKRPAVEEFKRLTSQPASAWGMVDSDVVELCDYILVLERELEQAAIRFEMMHQSCASLTGAALIGGENCRTPLAR